MQPPTAEKSPPQEGAVSQSWSPPPQPCLPFKSVTRMKWNFGAKKNVPFKVTDDKTLFLTSVNQNFRHRATKTTHLICVACYFVKSEQDVPGNTWEKAACTVFPKHTCRRLSVLLQAHRDPPCTDAVLDISLLVSVPNISATFQISRTWILFLTDSNSVQSSSLFSMLKKSAKWDKRLWRGQPGGTGHFVGWCFLWSGNPHVLQDGTCLLCAFSRGTDWERN